MVKSELISLICVVTLASSGTLAQLPDHFDWRDVNGKDWMTPVKYQGDCGSCWAFTAVGTVEAQYNIFWDWADYDIDLSEEHLVSLCFPQWDCDGGWHYDALDFIKDSGITDEACFPYVDSDCVYRVCGCTFGCTNANCSEEYRCAEWQTRLWKIDGKVHVDNTVEAIKTYIYNVGPVGVCLDWANGDFDENGIWRCKPDAWYHHCVILAGWDETDDYWIAKNSWGPAWPPHDPGGYFKVGFWECLVQNLAYGVTLVNPDTDKFYIKNASGETVAWFGDRGNLVLKGTLTTEVDPLEEDPAHDEFRVQDSEGNDVAIIDATNGNMYISGLHKNWHTPSEGKDEFIIRNSNDDPVAYISDEGHLYLKGKLYQHPNP